MQTDTVPTIIGRRYRLLERLGAGAMGAVYRADDRLTGDSVALKQVMAPTEKLQFASRTDNVNLRVALAHEFQSLASLRHPHIIGVLDYGFDAEKQPYFTMELLENAETIMKAGTEQALPAQINLLAQMLRALAYLHRRGFVHRDLKPGNVLVADGRVRVLDFGLSVEIEQSTGGAGTIAYMAPEVLQGEPATPSSDLYAVGIMAYELFTGRHPFETASISKLVQQILAEDPDLTAAGIDPRLSGILQQLLAKAPAERFQNAAHVIEALGSALSQPLPLETLETRESFLQTVPLVGRGEEIRQLSVALTQMIENNHGGAWLIGGESGVGKSRLLDELRIRALVRGAAVLRGQAVSDGSRAYELWSNSIRRLILLTDLSDFEVSVLKPLVPDIAGLLERDVADAPVLDGKAAQTRVVSVITDIVKRQKQPAVIILEDLHWAEVESLELLGWLIRWTSDVPLMLIGSYRDDERPDLPAKLPGAQVMKLKKLSEENVAKLSETMLGEVVHRERVVELLHSETEGNVFFLIEVVRALAEEVGELSKIASTTIPADILSGGMQRIIQRRLSRVPAEAHPLLQIAAVAGRQLNLAVLRAADPTIDLEQWLTNCANAAVLDVQEERWRFAHDKLREGLLADLDDEHCRNLHRRVAVAIEAAYPDSTIQAATLAHHWSMVRDHQKELYYAAIAGEQALRNGANQEALKYLRRALELDAQLHPGTPTPEDQLRRAGWERHLGEALLGLGSLTDSREHMRKTLDLLGTPEPTARPALFANIMKQVVVQIWHRLRPARQGHTTDKRLLEAALAYERIGELRYFSYDTPATLNGGMCTMNLVENTGTSPVLARAYANMSVAAGVVPLHSVAEFYLRRARETARQVNEPRALAFTLSRTSIYRSGVGKWTDVDESFQEAINIADRIGDKRQWGESMATLSLVAYFRGQFERSRELFAQLHGMARQTGDIQHQSWGLFWQAQSLIRLGKLNEAISLLNQSFTLLQENPQVEDRAWAINNNGLMGMARLYCGEYGPARESAEAAARLVGQSSITNFATFEGYVAPAEVFLKLWEAGVTAPDQATLIRQARQSVAVARKYAHPFPIGEPRYWLWEGLYQWLSGHQDRAHEAWQKSQAAAQRVAMPLDEGLAYYEIGRHSEGTARQTNLTRAAEIFDKLGTAFHLDQTRKAMSK